MEKEKALANLLNDESFLRWLKNEADKREEREWNRWVSANPDYKELIEKAQKIISMPFNEWGTFTDMDQELERLLHELEGTTNLKLFKHDS